MKRGFQAACMAVWLCDVIRYDYHVRWSHVELQFDVLMYMDARLLWCNIELCCHIITIM